MSQRKTIQLDPGKRVLFLTKDPDMVRRQLSGELNLHMKDLQVEDLMDDINTDVMTPAWACFNHKPEEIARHAQAIGDPRGRGRMQRGIFGGETGVTSHRPNRHPFNQHLVSDHVH